ncbi:MAG: ABC-type transport auxiliary lipoprotein family protein [Bryobacterales bacterium]
MPLIKVLPPAALGLLLLVSCGGGKTPATRYYALDLPAAPVKPAADALRNTLAVMPVRATEMLAQDRIVYRPTREEVGYYEYHRWAEDPRTSIQNALLNRLRETGAFVTVGLYDGRTKADYQLRTRIDRLEEVDFEQGVKVYTKISAELVDGQTARVVWTGEGTGEGVVSQSDVGVVVQQMSAASKQAIDQIADGVNKFLRS